MKIKLRFHMNMTSGYGRMTTVTVFTLSEKGLSYYECDHHTSSFRFVRIEANI